jgi:hypothetical protein
MATGQDLACRRVTDTGKCPQVMHGTEGSCLTSPTACVGAITAESIMNLRRRYM